MKKLLELLLNYGTQQTTWVGITAILTALGITLKPELANAIASCGLAVFGLIKVIVNEKADKDAK